jgi:chromosome segregation ATPase
MPDNLTITIRADTAKLRADLALGVADLKRFQQELNKVAAEASRSGDTAAVGQAAARVQQQTQYVAGLRQALGGLTQAHRQAAAATEDFHSKLAALREPIGRVREGISTFAERVLPAFVGALAGLTLGEVTRQLVEFTAKSAEATTQIKELAETLGATAPEIQAMQLAAVQAGRPLDSFTSSVERLQRQIGQARLAAQDLQQQQFGTGRVVDYGAGIARPRAHRRVPRPVQRRCRRHSAGYRRNRCSLRETR